VTSLDIYNYNFLFIIVISF